MQPIRGLAVIQIPFDKVNMIHSEVSCHLKRYLYRNRGDYREWQTERGLFMPVDSSANHIVLPSWCEANISKGLISRSPIKHKMVLAMASGWMENVKRRPCWELTVFILIGRWDYWNYGYPHDSLKILLDGHYLTVKQDREREREMFQCHLFLSLTMTKW